MFYKSLVRISKSQSFSESLETTRWNDVECWIMSFSKTHLVEWCAFSTLATLTVAFETLGHRVIFQEAPNIYVVFSIFVNHISVWPFSLFLHFCFQAKDIVQITGFCTHCCLCCPFCIIFAALTDIMYKNHPGQNEMSRIIFANLLKLDKLKTFVWYQQIWTTLL